MEDKAVDKVDDLIISDELAKLHRDLTPLEYLQLERNCIEDGCILDPIVIWGRYVLDGRHRLKIAKENGLAYDIKVVDLGDMEDAKRWVVNNQLGKRNLTEFEAARLRAEQAKMDGTQATAEAHGVTRRTVQRDLEADSNRQIMPDDIREKCEKGTIVNSKRALKEYAELNDDMRAAVDSKLRENPTLTLQQAIPNKSIGITPEEYAALNENTNLDARHKRSISLGTIHADSKSINEFCAMTNEAQQLVSDLLGDRDIDSLGDAILNYKVGSKPIPLDDDKKVEKTSAKIRKMLEDVMRHLDDLKALRADKSGHRDCIKAVKDVMAAFDSWR